MPLDTSFPIPVARSVADLRKIVFGWRRAGERVALVPTMGALHAGHLSLSEAARAQANRVVVSIFVNPTQFAPNEDFERYPRNLGSDIEKLARQGFVGLVYAPTAAEMYPNGFSTAIRVAGVSEGLESAARPHFFGGVATVVAKLFMQAQPDVAIFGEKDYQQLLVIRRLVRDLDIPVEIVAAPTLREHDGLAMSSRNAYLTAPERKIAGFLNTVLGEVAAAVAGGKSPSEACNTGRARLLKLGFAAVDYLEVRDADSLDPIEMLNEPARVLAAVRLGGTRLIDNAPVLPKAD
ncbi:MAG: pantoate--beta-alanine ligase [Alphaproteobacteria bacterium]|nr:pantoate--beta-alanine ligase [Alphaproteobacteria bacterium]